MKKSWISILLLVNVIYTDAQVQYAGTAVKVTALHNNLLNTNITVPTSAFTGNLIVIAVTEYKNSYPLTITDETSKRNFQLAKSTITRNGSLVAIYFLIDAYVGTHRIKVSTGAGNNTNIETITTVYTGVDLYAPIAMTGSNANTVANNLPSLSISCSTDQLVVDAMIYERSDLVVAAPLPGSNVTFVDKNEFKLESASSSNISGQLDLSWDYTKSASGFWGAVALTLQPTRYAIVPGQLINFAGKAVNEKIELSWVTTFETNLNYISVMRSTDNKEWKEIVTVEASGNSSIQKAYQVADNNIGNGTYFYRLVFVSEDGRKSYSSIVNVRSTIEKKLRFANMPNPFINNLQVALFTSSDKEVVVTILNSKGITIATKTLRPEGGTLNFSVPHSINLAPGIYFVQCSSDSEKICKTMVKN